MSPMTTSGLWSRAFAHTGDGFDGERDRLRLALERMRDNVSSLVKTIPADCKDLTIHDVTHLDALWEMATILTGEDWPLNPAEAFVLGGAILLHDAGMSAAAFPGGLTEIMATDEWQDVAASALRERELEVTPEAVRSPPPQLAASIKFEVLRALHAEQAEKMATTSWTLPGGEALTLLEDHELRIAFGASIGRIAHSHHWSIERVAEQLSEHIGSGTAFPSEWSVNEKKIGCVLRCADACHIDRRRAPAILLAATKPSGVSAQHWVAQSKINKPKLRDGTIIYSAGQTYKQEDAAAWWIAYDLITLADQEIRSSNALLEEIGVRTFQVSRVLGAGSPRALSQHLRPDGWRPIDAEVRVTDPVHLARTLGGSRLYGDDPLAPVRELLQNSADAIRARRLIEDRPITWGSIVVTIEEHEDDKGACWLHIDDDGVGMTERVLSGPLIDFGKSIWNSSLLRDEFPGLQAKNIKPIGKFGIGFFSVFELGDEVKVSSRKYDSGISDAKCLEFKMLASRPIVRPCRKGELPRDVLTRVSVKVKDKSRITGKRTVDNVMSNRRYVTRTRSIFGQDVQRLVAMLDVKVTYDDKITNYKFDHDADVYGLAAEKFIESLCPEVDGGDLKRITDACAPLLDNIISENGENIGRAAIYTPSQGESEAMRWSGTSVGGFVYKNGAGIRVPIVGVIEGDTKQASRQSAVPKASAQSIASWASRQAQLIDMEKYLPGQLMLIAEKILQLGGDSGSLPFCFSKNKTISRSEAVNVISSLDRVIIPITLEYSTWLKTVGYSDLGSNYFNIEMIPEVFVIRETSERLFEEDEAREIVRGQRSIFTESDIRTRVASLDSFISAVREAWGSDLVFAVEQHAIFDARVLTPPPPRWTIVISKP